jgi:hypothetical protein
MPAMRLTSLLLLSLAAAPLAGQGAIRADLVTVKPYGNHAREGSRQDFASWPVNTALPAGQSHIGAQADNAFADTILGWNIWPGDIVTADVSDQGGGSAGAGPLVVGTTSSPSLATLQQGPHELRLRILGAPGTRGKIEVWATGAVEPGARASLAADLHDDTSIDFRVDITTRVGSFDRRQWSVALDQAGELRVRIITEASAAIATGHTVYKTGISVRFTPGSFCDLSSYGSWCGPYLTGSDAMSGQTREFTLQLGGATPGAAGLLLLGTQRLSLPLPGTVCLLQTDPLVVIPFAVDGNGFATTKLGAPLGLPLAVNLQDVLITQALSVTSTNGVALRCP